MHATRTSTGRLPRLLYEYEYEYTYWFSSTRVLYD